MDLGAVLCRPVAPHCEVCPLRETCAWRGRGVDPALGSAGVSTRQSRFDGSDRQARGRLMKALTAGPVGCEQVPAVMRCEARRAGRLANDLEREGLVVRDGTALCLPT
jgi:A/G-specific adenine glycosylase